MLQRMLIAIAAVMLLAPMLDAQAPSRILTQATKDQFDDVKGYLSRTAQKVPEDMYGFRPTPEVRTLGQIIGHVADANFVFCAMAVGDTPSQSGIEKGKTSKADLVAALNASIAYCDRAFATMNDQKGLETVKFFNGTPAPRMAVLAYNNSHCNEHYGNLVTYLRLKGIIPPSSER